MSGLLRNRSRTGVTALLLGFSVLTTFVLAVQAHWAFSYHRVTAEQVLRDFAGLAGQELVRRSAARLAYDGYTVLIEATARYLRAEGPAGDTVAMLSGGPDARVRQAAGLARCVFAATPSERRLVFAPTAPSASTREWLMETLLPEHAPKGGFTVVHGVIAGEPHSFAFTAAGGRLDWQLVGIEVALDRLGPWLRAAFEEGPLLPPSVGHGRVTNEALFIAVTDHGGVERFRAGTEASAGLAVDVRFGDAYSGVLTGSHVRVSVDPGAARDLVIGGLPRSRLPLLLGLLALSTGLVVLAMLQLRRERALQQMRSEFVASVSHELRTPLTQIRMFAETLLLERVRTSEERRRALEILDREARRLAQLVENVLLFSRAERGALELSPETRPLAPVVREVLEQFQPVAAGSAVRVEAQLDEQATATFDPAALRQILVNLLDNAVKYGPRGQELHVGLERAGGTLRLSVDDEGPGVPASERTRVFERFHRLERDRHSAVAGAGIGLAVVLDLVERQRGRISVVDGARGGACFVLELPA